MPMAKMEPSTDIDQDKTSTILLYHKPSYDYSTHSVCLLLTLQNGDTFKQFMQLNAPLWVAFKNLSSFDNFLIVV